MVVDVPKLKLNNGLEMPAFGLGTYGSRGGEGIKAIKAAIDIGYRHIDTAYLYNNEQEIGEAARDKIAEGVVSRDDLFIVTKLWCTFHEPDKVEYACRKSLENLGLDYIDLFLMHFPVGFVHHGDEIVWPKNPDGTQETSDVDYLDTWKAMEKLVKLGLVKSIGLSNFNSQQIERVLAAAEIKPVANQVECSPEFNQKKLTKFCKVRDIVLISYSPLGHPKENLRTPNFIYDQKVLEIAKKHKKTSAQVVLRFLHEIGTVPIPKSVRKERIESNIDIFDFKLSKEDAAVMEGYHTGKRRVGLSDAKHCKFWPFGIEY